MSAQDLPQVPDNVEWPIILGIDPGTLVVGYGAVVVRPEGPALLAAGALRASRSGDVPTRLGFIRQEIDMLLKRLRPNVVVVEHAYTAINVQSALRVGEGRGVALSAAACAGAKVVQYQASQAKKTLVGVGSADKERVAKMVAMQLGLESAPEPLDASDALALALTYIHRQRFEDQLGASRA
ncbi:MAG: crossover junction endodeoxyribonuclease RuvC [Planctomycetota bacterium]|jgi:crossover junction endodeoxyribonuclease RuvC